MNLEIGKTNWYLTVIANDGGLALSLVVSQMADPTQSWSAIFMFCSDNGRWQAATSSSVSDLQTKGNIICTKYSSSRRRENWVLP